MNRTEFYETLKYRIHPYLPMGCKGMPIHIEEKEAFGKKQTLFTMQANGKRQMPIINIESYWKQVEAGADVGKIVIDMAIDYTRELFDQRQPKRNLQMGR